MTGSSTASTPQRPGPTMPRLSVEFERARRSVEFAPHGTNRNSMDIPSAPGTYGPFGGQSFNSCPAVGASADKGHRSTMEDAYSIQPDLVALALPEMVDDTVTSTLHPSTPTLSFRPTPAPPATPTSLSASRQHQGQSSTQSLHFVAVFDGHGGNEIAQHCSKRMQHHVCTALAEIAIPSGTHCIFNDTIFDFASARRERRSSMEIYRRSSIDGHNRTRSSIDSHRRSSMDSAWRNASDSCSVSRQDSGDSSASPSLSTSSSEDCPGRVPRGTFSPGTSPALSEIAIPEDMSAFRQAAHQRMHGGSSGSKAGRPQQCLVEAALKRAYLTIDLELMRTFRSSAALMGSTAVVTLVGQDRIWVANCGDSRAVLLRGSEAVPLSRDHKPSRADERERIERLGGHIVEHHGQRVQGVLAMTRALGDHALRPYIICEPEITCLPRQPDDKLMLLASDGLWDVLSCGAAASLVQRAMARAQEMGAARASAARIAARVLTRAAIEAGSRDNVTAVVLDLAPGQQQQQAAQR